MSKHPSKSKAKKILEHGEIRGKKLTKKQRGMFGAVAGGEKLSSTPKYSARGKLNKY